MRTRPVPTRRGRRALWLRGRGVSIRRGRSVLLAVVGLVLALVAGGCASGSSAPEGGFTFVSPGGKIEFNYPVAERKMLGEIAGPNLSGTEQLSTADYRGMVVVLNFWASDCGPCRAESGDLQAASVALAGQGVQFLGLDVKDSQDAARAFNQARQITYPSIYDPAGQTMVSVRGFPSAATPSTIVLDRAGRVAHIWLSRITRDPLIATVSAIASEPT